MTITLQGITKMTSSQIEQVDDNIVQPVATQLDVIATKDEQIKALITSVQDLKQQLASAQQHITANEITIKDMSARFKTLEDSLDVTRQELNATTITGRQMKDELAKQSEEHFKAFEKLQSLNQKLKCAEGNITVFKEEMKEELNVVKPVADLGGVPRVPWNPLLASVMIEGYGSL